MGERIKQVMPNFASNAIKYTDSWRIDIYLGSQQTSCDMTQLIYKVTDTGQGIRQENMDRHMPVMNGEEATRRIREHLISIGMDDYIVKPIDMELLCEVMRKYLPAEKVEL